MIMLLSFSYAQSDNPCINEKGQSICISGTCETDSGNYCGEEGTSFVDQKCFCRPECKEFGDCCADYFEACPISLPIPGIRDLEVTVPSKFKLNESQTAVVKNYNDLRIKLVSVPETLGPQDTVSITVTKETSSVSRRIRRGEIVDAFGLNITLLDTSIVQDTKSALLEIALRGAIGEPCDNVCGADDFEQCPPCVQDHCLEVLCRIGKCKKDCDKDSNKINASVPSTFYLRISQTAHLTNHRELDIKLDGLSSNASNESGVPIAILDINLPGGCGPGAPPSCLGPPARFYDDEEVNLNGILEVEGLRINFQNLINVTSNGTSIFKAQFHVSKLIEENITPLPSCNVEPRNANCTCGAGFKKQVKPKVNGTSDCPPGQHKNPQGICVNNTACLSHQHIGPGGECINNTNGTMECPPGKLKDAQGNCVECISDANCQSGKKCELGNCVAIESGRVCPGDKVENSFGNCGPANDLPCQSGYHKDALAQCVKDLTCEPGSGIDTNNYCPPDRYPGGPDDAPLMPTASGGNYVELGQMMLLTFSSDDPKRPDNINCIVGPTYDIFKQIAAGHCKREIVLYIDWGDNGEGGGLGGTRGGWDGSTGLSVGLDMVVIQAIQTKSVRTFHRYTKAGDYKVKMYTTFLAASGGRQFIPSEYTSKISEFDVKVAPSQGRAGVVVGGTNLYARISESTPRKSRDKSAHSGAIPQGTQNAPIVIYELNTVDDKPATVTGIKFGNGLWDALSVKRMKILNSNGQVVGTADWGAPVIRGCDWWRRYNYITIPHGPISIQLNQPIEVPAGSKVSFTIAADIARKGSWFNGVQFPLMGVAVDGHAIEDNLASGLSIGENIGIDGCFDANGDCTDDLTRAACPQNVPEDEA